MIAKIIGIASMIGMLASYSSNVGVACRANSINTARWSSRAAAAPEASRCSLASIPSTPTPAK